MLNQWKYPFLSWCIFWLSLIKLTNLIDQLSSLIKFLKFKQVLFTSIKFHKLVKNIMSEIC